MFYQGPPGLMVDLAQPSLDGVDLLYSHEYVAVEIARRNTNAYTYANNNPLRYVDPSGLQAEGLTPEQQAQVDKCRAFFDKSIVNDKKFEKCWERFQARVRSIERAGEADRAKRCADLQFHCICCDRGSTGAFYRPSEHAIYMCAQQRYFQGGPTATAATRVCHELIHVLQYAPCHARPLLDNCYNLMLRELEAYYCSNECRNFAGCIIFVRGSLRPSPLCKEGEPTQQQINDAKSWFDAAIRDPGFCAE